MTGTQELIQADGEVTEKGMTFQRQGRNSKDGSEKEHDRFRELQLFLHHLRAGHM